MVTAIPMMDGPICRVQNTMGIHLQICTNSNSDNCASVSLLYLCSLGAHSLLLPDFHYRSLIAFPLFHEAVLNWLSPWLFQGQGRLSGTCRNALVTLFAVRPWLPKLYQGKQPEQSKGWTVLISFHFPTRVALFFHPFKFCHRTVEIFST